MAGSRERLLRHREDPVSASFLELFFDLAFVFTLNQVGAVLLADPSIDGALRTALLLATVWFLWVTTTWSADWYAPDAPVVRVVRIGAALAGLLMGVAVPAALDDRSALFVGAYLVVNAGRGLLGLVVLRGHPLRRRIGRILCWFAASGVLWLAGLFLPAARVPLWGLALLVEYAGPSVGWPTPWLGRSRPQELRLRGAHFAERFRQVFIISLGELIFSAGLAYAESETSPAQTGAFLLIFATAVLLGLLYVTPGGRQLASAIERARPTRLGTASNLLHLVMIAGVVSTAVAAEVVIGHPGEPGAVAVVVAGPALFLAGRLLLSAAINRRISLPRLLGLPVLVAVGLVAADLPLLVATAVTTAVLVAVAVLDRARVFAPG
ncbi:low temperature requirement protein A [Micromonospora musae]|uniref:Low temperature requirement protein A n=1 Tax=Micromonospora musae TaxID=1894970 RepID=A0A3A9XTU5_9ACTN|nr:low temperature requirement protein A [Micromonospora musae]RKN28628.1 low temperature requirement protein A [Micromonospora musae]